MKPTIQWVIDCIKTVFDPEFPLVDIRTMGLIYDIKIMTLQGEVVSSMNQDAQLSSWSDQLWDGDDDRVYEIRWIWERDDEWFVSYNSLWLIVIDMTLTTPACPAADYLPEQAKNSVQVMYPEYEVTIVMVRDPTWTIEMIKDEDLKRMFE